MDFLRRCAGQRCIPCRAGANAIAPRTGYLELRSTASSGKSKRAAPLLARLLRCIPREIVIRAGAALLLGASVSACATTGHTWKEEVLLHDGQKLVVERNVERGGRREVGQQPPIKQQSVSFKMPATQEEVVWGDQFSPDLGTANFLPMLLDVKEGVAYLVAHPMGCLSYNKWGRPNPPYVVFKYQARMWSRIALAELPSDIRSPNLIFSSPDDEARNLGKDIVSATEIQKLYSSYRQPEYRSILREELPKARIDEMCEERVFYKGYWVLPNDPIARKLIDQKRP